jgi:hypothetical protein
VQTLCLGVHATYRCRSSGACCSSGWAIDVEPDVAAGLRLAQASGRLGSSPDVPRSLVETPQGVRLGTDTRGRCGFFDLSGDRLCGVHRTLGHAALPSACRHFPRVVLLAPHAVKLTLSHFCPTAAGLLFGASRQPERVVRNAPAFPSACDYEGLDARSSLPPLLRPGVLMSWEGYEGFERAMVRELTGPAGPDLGLARLARAARRAREWTLRAGPQDDFVEQAVEAAAREPAPETGCEADGRLYARVAACVLPGVATPAPAPRWEGALRERVASAWSEHRAPIGCFLAAHAFASWCALQGPGLETTVRAVRAARAVLRVEAARACAISGHALDAGSLREAMRRTDLLLRHLVDPAALARELGREEAPGAPGATPRGRGATARVRRRQNT